MMLYSFPYFLPVKSDKPPRLEPLQLLTANVAAIMKQALLEEAMLSRGAKETMVEVVGEFILFITGEGEWPGLPKAASLMSCSSREMQRRKAKDAEWTGCHWSVRATRVGELRGSHAEGSEASQGRQTS